MSPARWDSGAKPPPGGIPGWAVVAFVLGVLVGMFL